MSQEESDYSHIKGNVSPYDSHLKTQNYAREKKIAAEWMGIVRDRLTECIRANHVNQFVECKDLREQYFKLCIDRYHGMIFPPGEEPVNRDIPGLRAPKKY